jgi:hypothetical protein
MRLVKTTVTRMRKMSEEHGKEVRPFCERVTFANLESEDNAIELLTMSHKLGLDFNELCMYVWLQVCIAESVFTPEELAEMCGFNLEESEDYIQEQTETMRRNRFSHDDPSRMTPVDFTWEKPEDEELDLQEGAEHLTIVE